MKQYINPNSKDWGALLERPTANYKDLEPLVDQVFLQVKSKGDEALIDYTSIDYATFEKKSQA